MKKNISMAVIRRLPKYQRYLRDLQDKGVDRISSKQLSNIIGFTASQIRQDLNNFGKFGKQGYGYPVSGLLKEVEYILGMEQSFSMIILGGGHLGHAIANYGGFRHSSFDIKAVFDIDPQLIGTKINEIPVLSMKEIEQYVITNQISVAAICIPKDKAQEQVDQLVELGIKGIWNFAPIDLEVPDTIAVEQVSLIESLEVLSFMLQDASKDHSF